MTAKYTYLTASLFLISVICFSQNSSGDETLDSDYSIKEIIELPKSLNESSGLLILDSLVISFNDSGNKPVLFGLDSESGKVKYEWLITNVKNNDWEDIAQDEDFIYIGDFGNNLGKRRDLAIYKVDKRLLFSKENNIVADKIYFSFEDQTEFKTTFYQHSFDCEAMICWNDSIFIFSKDWKDKKTTSYSLPKSPGTYVAKKKQVYDVMGLVTGADYDEGKNMLVFSGYLNFQPILWLFKDFESPNFFSGSSKRIDILQLSGIQNEGISFLKDGTILMSSEKKNMPARLFKIEINNF